MSQSKPFYARSASAMRHASLILPMAVRPLRDESLRHDGGAQGRP